VVEIGRDALERLVRALNARSIQAFVDVGGEISFFVKGEDGSAEWTLAVQDKRVVLLARKARGWVCRIGLTEAALLDIASGALDVQQAFDARRIAVAGHGALERLARCLAPLRASAAAVKAARSAL
jgi:hypothetical protein